ncbi:putative regulator protein [Rhizobium tropici CIAT 899]|nr:putative regulator protein [Rhizobium tropici CIAT 899]
MDRSDRANPEIRARIYQSARQALEAGLRKQDITDVNVVAAQRQRLEATIREIEAEERAHAAQAMPVSPELSTPNVSPSAPRPEAGQSPQRPEPVMSVRGETRDPPMSANAAAPVEPMSVEPGGRGDDFGDMRAGPADHLGADSDVRPTAAAAPAARSMNFKPERAAVRRKPRKFFSRLLVFCILLAFLGVGAWWIKTSGVLMSASQRDTSVPNPPAHVDSQDFSGNSNDEDTSDQDDNSGPVNPGLATIDPQNSFSAEWLEVLKPTDAPKVTTSPQSKAENVSENEGPAVRLTSLSSGPDGSGSIEVPVNVLQQMAGKASTVALTLQSTSDAPTQITVECDFGSLGRCGRHRFTVSRQKTDSLFQVKFDRAMAPTSSGRLIINSDVDGKARGVNIYAIRVLPGQ